MNARIPFAAPEEIHRALAALGRTEDVKFSPDGRRIALAGFARNRILIVDIAVDTSSPVKRVLLTDYLEITSPALRYPHGICFLDDQTIVVANRGGVLPVFKVPAHHTEKKSHCLPTPDAVIGREWVYSPGSVTAHEIEPGLHAVLVCNNYAHYVSRHIVSTAGGRVDVRGNDILLSRGLDVPDGIAISHDRRWIAVSNHNTHSVWLFANVAAANERAEPAGVLEHVDYPHGLCFTPDDEHVLVADAGRPQIHVYARGDGSWSGTRAPAASIEVMDPDTFARGRYNPQEGGPKGLDANPRDRMVVTTSEHQLLTFLDLPALARRAAATGSALRGIGARTSVPESSAASDVRLGGSDVAGRNRICLCGSGQRFKRCCGRSMPPTPPGSASELARLKSRALELHRSGRLDEAERLYRAALELSPDEPDCLHMLGAVLYTLERATEASPLVRRAGKLSHWKLPGIGHNFALIVGARLTDREPERATALRRQYDEWAAACTDGAGQRPAPLVSIVIPSCNQAEHVEAALDSVFAQTYRKLELIVIDDGSDDGSPEIIRKKLEGCPWPHQFIARESRGAPATLNEAIALARGEYVNPLDADDLFEPTRIAIMLEAVAAHGVGWGFALCHCIDATGHVLAPHSSLGAGSGANIEEVVRAADTVGMAMLGERNPAVCAGNLFFSRALFERVSGFRALQSNHDRDFCLRLLWHAEPRFVTAPLYRYRLHGARASRDSLQRNGIDVASLASAYHAVALHEAPVNRFAPARSTMGLGYIAPGLITGQGDALSPDMLMDLDDEASRFDQAARRVPDALGDGLNIVGRFRGDLGLAESARILAKTCESESIPAVYRDAAVSVGTSRSNRTMDHRLTDRLPHRNLLFCIEPDQLAQVSQRYADRGELDGRYVIGCWHWDIDAFPDRRRHAIDRVDEIWVATDFVRNAIQCVADKPVWKIPHAIDAALERPWRRIEFSLPEDAFLFLHSFDFESSAERRNPAAAIRAFQRAFPNDRRRVGLVVKCSRGFAHPEELRALWALVQDDPRIVIIDKMLSGDRFLGLQSVCDACISLHRSEALGLGMAQSMALGKPVIATAYSGNLEFMTPENSCLVDYALIPVKPGDYIDYEPGWRWADADVDHAAGYMQRIVEDDAYRRRIGDRARLDMAANFSHQIAARAIRARLSGRDNG